MNLMSSKKLNVIISRLVMVSILLVGMTLSATALATTVRDIDEMTAFDGQWQDGLGTSLAIDGTTVVAGSSRASYGSFNRAGAAYIYDCSSLPCITLKKLFASDASDFDGLGYSVAISGSIVVLGGNGANDTVHVYDVATCSVDLICYESQKLTASDGGEYDAFGVSVAIVGQTVVVGSILNSYDGKTHAGAAYVFDLATCGAACNETRKLTASDAAASDRLGGSVAVDGTTAVVGSTEKKAGYVFNLATCGAACTEVSKLTNSEATGAFGDNVDVSGSTAILGAASGSLGQSWGAYIFDLASCGSACNEVSKLLPADFQSDEAFGYAVAIDGTTALVGNYDDLSGRGSAYVFNVATCGASCTEATELRPLSKDLNARFGLAVDLSGIHVVVSAPGDSTGTGAVHLFTGADLQISKAASQDQITAGDQITYTLVVTNNGPFDVTAARVQDTLPAQLSLASWQCVADQGAQCTASGNEHIDDLVDLPAGTSVTFTLIGTTDSIYTGIIANTASVTAPDSMLDPLQDNNSVTAELLSLLSNDLFQDSFED